jgi:hypothetical protein
MASFSILQRMQIKIHKTQMKDINMSKNQKAKDNNFKDKANVCERSKRLKPKHSNREGRTVRE